MNTLMDWFMSETTGAIALATFMICLWVGVFLTPIMLVVGTYQLARQTYRAVVTEFNSK